MLTYIYDPTNSEGSPDVGLIVMHSSHVPPLPKVTDTYTKFEAPFCCDHKILVELPQS